MVRSKVGLKGIVYYISILCLAVVCFSNQAVFADDDLPVGNYFEEYAEMEADSDAEDILIVVSDIRPDDYGAKRIIEAPNNTYYLQFDSEIKRDEAWELLRQNDSVKVVPNVLVDINDGEESDETENTYEYMSWGIEAMGIDNIVTAVDEKADKNEILVAVIDTGVNEYVFNEVFPERSLDSYCVVACENGMEDLIGHGTHIIGTIAEGTSDNVSLLMIRTTTNGSFSIASLLTAVNYAVEQGADVINISSGTPLNFNDETYNSQYNMTMGEIYHQIWEIEKQTIDAAVEAGAIIVSAAGNEGQGTVAHYPASYDTVISVGAVNGELDRADFSNYNEFLDFVAPGTMIGSLNWNYRGEEGQKITTKNQGTSMATPHITAVVAGLLSFNQDLTFDDVMELLKSRAVDLGEPGRDDYYGKGFIDLKGALFCDEGYVCDEYGVFSTGELLPDDGEDDNADENGEDDEGDDDKEGSDEEDENEVKEDEEIEEESDEEENSSTENNNIDNSNENEVEVNENKNDLDKKDLDNKDLFENDKSLLEEDDAIVVGESQVAVPMTGQFTRRVGIVASAIIMPTMVILIVFSLFIIKK